MFFHVEIFSKKKRVSFFVYIWAAVFTFRYVTAFRYSSVWSRWFLSCMWSYLWGFSLSFAVFDVLGLNGFIWRLIRWVSGDRRQRDFEYCDFEDLGMKGEQDVIYVLLRECWIEYFWKCINLPFRLLCLLRNCVAVVVQKDICFWV